MSATEKDFYRILGVIDSAELAVIKAAYKALMMIYHPDKYQGNADEAVRRSKEINEAYAVLNDPIKRKNMTMIGLQKKINMNQNLSRKNKSSLMLKTMY